MDEDEVRRMSRAEIQRDDNYTTTTTQAPGISTATFGITENHRHSLTLHLLSLCHCIDHHYTSSDSDSK
jgi:hypothetical protein